MSGEFSSRLQSVSEFLPLAVPRSNRLAYVGATDHTNLGDQAMYEVHQSLFPDHQIVQIPSGTRSRLLRGYSRFYGRAPAEAVLLGGGTLIGRPAYLRRLRAFRDHFPELPLYCVGTGVEDPEFGKGRTDKETLREWSDLLREFDIVTVRGPRSHEILTGLGVNCRVVGDSALALTDQGPTATEPGLVGLNTGVVTHLWGDDPDSLFSSLVSFGKLIGKTGRRVRVVTTWADDVEMCEELTKRIGPSAELVVGRSPAQVMESIERCEVVVGVKLHAVVLAAARSVPTVMVEYRPKCSDFHDSIGLGEFTLRSDTVSSEKLLDMVESLLTQRDRVVDVVNKNVTELRSRIHDTSREIRTLLQQPHSE